MFGLTGLEVDHNRFIVQAATVAQQRSVDEDCIRGPQSAISGVDMAKHMEPWLGLEDRFQKLRASLVKLRPWRSVKNAKGWAMRNQDVQAPSHRWVIPIPSSFRLPPVPTAS